MGSNFGNILCFWSGQRFRLVRVLNIACNADVFFRRANTIAAILDFKAKKHWGE